MRIDKTASVTINVSLEGDLTLAGECEGVPGTVCLVRALGEKRVYDKIELVTGRKAKISRGDVIAGVLGERRALMGFVGAVPKSVRRGDVLNILNLGGVIGKALSYNRDYGHPLEVEFLGAVMKNGAPLNISENALDLADTLGGERVAPVVTVAGTSMNSGKTEVASRTAQELTWKGLRVCSVKASGIAALRDMLNMQDHGAVKSLSFLDFGFPSTVHMGNVPSIAKGALRRLAAYEPDVVIVELGDGLLGDYGVLDFYRDEELRGVMTCNIVCALDPVGAWGARQLADQQLIPIHLISGPVTDDSAGLDFLRDRLNTPGINAIAQQEELGAFVARLVTGSS